MSNKKKIKLRLKRPTYIEIDLRALDFNLRNIRKVIGKGVKIMAIVKSNAYGHGMTEVSKRLKQNNIDYLGVANIEEGMILRKENIKVPILILSAILPSQAALVLDYNLAAAVSNYDIAFSLNREAGKRGVTACVHIKIDTGMGRQGVNHKEALEFIKKVSALKFLKIEGIFTHLSSAESDRNFTLAQIRIFRKLLNNLKKANIHIPFIHAANSMGVIGYKSSHFNLVRPGLVLYGLYPRRNLYKKLTLKPVMKLKSRVIFKKNIPKGYGISYGRTYRAKSNMQIAILPIGYGDGYLRSLSNKAEVLIKGKVFKVVGKICMDQSIVGIYANKKVNINDEAVLLGRQRGKSITAEQLAERAATIPYEIVCALGQGKIPKIYIGS